MDEVYYEAPENPVSTPQAGNLGGFYVNGQVVMSFGTDEDYYPIEGCPPNALVANAILATLNELLKEHGWEALVVPD